MQFGISTLTRGATANREGYLAIARRADELGYGFISVNDHVVVPADIGSRYPYSEQGKWAAADEGHCFEQLTTMGFLAGCTTNIRLLTSVMVVPHRHPVLAAKMLATADVLSGGRVIAGCGAGWMKEEFDVLGAPYEDRGRATDEFIEAFRALWTEARPRYSGTHVQFSEVLFAPKPIQKPLPVWIGGESAPAMRRAAKLGDGWYPGSGNPAHRLETRDALIAAHSKLDGMAREAGRDPKAIDRAYVVQWPVSWEAHSGSAGQRRWFTGSAADMAEDAAALAAIGIRHVALRLQTDSLQETLDRIQRFGEDVIPLVRAV
jgi:probable F420-dependent oxidoreductase